jgi:hypothetical protein
MRTKGVSKLLTYSEAVFNSLIIVGETKYLNNQAYPDIKVLIS